MPPVSSQSDDPAGTQTPERRSADSLISALLLAFVGGVLDAFLYLNHGHVFAGAMTGNAVLCGIALLSHNGANALHHALPLLAFLCGVWLAEVLENRLHHHAVTIGLGGEACGLLVASFLPLSFPNFIFVPLISLLAAYQIASFRKLDQYSYNSTFISGDLRTTIVGLYEALNPAKRTEGLRKAKALGLVVLSFVAGAVAGALLAPHYENHTLWLPVAALLVVFGSALRRSLGGETYAAQVQTRL